MVVTSNVAVRASLRKTLKKGDDVQSVSSDMQATTNNPIIEFTLLLSAQKHNIMSLLTAPILLLPFVDIVSAEEICPSSKLMEFMASPHFTTCVSDSGGELTSILSNLSLGEIKGYCDSAACAAYMKELEAAGLGDCKIVEINARLQTDFIDAFDAKCSAVRSMGSSSNATSNGRQDGSSSSATSGVAKIAVSCMATIILMLLM